MKRWIVGLVALVVLVGVGQAQAVVLTFDDIGVLDSAPYYEFVPDGYGGLNWESAFYFRAAEYTDYRGLPNSGFVNGRVSGEYVAETELLYITSDSPFDFNGVYLTGAFRDGLNIDVIGSLGGVVLYSLTVTVDSTAPTWFDFNFLGVDRVVFHSYGGTNAGYGLDTEGIIMDNFTFNEPVIPEPSTFAIWSLLGIIGITVGWGRRRRA